MPLLIHKRPDGTDKSLTFGDKPLIVGRLPESEISVRDAFISRVHCGISHGNSQFTLKDLGSTNGTYRNGARVFECSLATGDKIQVGNTTLVFEIDAKNGNALLRQVPQMVAPPLTVGGSTPPRPELKQPTMPVNPPGVSPPAIKPIPPSVQPK
ncbi:MAG TPA: FHA domain-containing protein [Verrucomicrobiae bacterium]|nr:FHA domain-containing protein [Verrucomicrobiae bacterium]